MINRKRDSFAELDSEDDYDVISSGASGLYSLESSLADLNVTAPAPREPPPSADSLLKFVPARLDAEDIQAYVAAALRSARVGADRLAELERPGRTVKVYVDGAFDVIHAGVALHLRQAKLAFPSVRLIVGVFSDPMSEPGSSTSPMYASQMTERAETLRHIRWVDAVLPDAPSIPTSAWLDAQGIDLVALEEGASVDPSFDPRRLAAYESLRKAGRVIPSRRTFNVFVPRPAAPAVPSPPLPAVESGNKELPPSLLDAPLPQQTVVTSPTVPSVIGENPGTLRRHKSPAIQEDALEGTPRTLLQRFEEGPPLDIYGIGI